MNARRTPDARWSAGFSLKRRLPGGRFEAHRDAVLGTDAEFSRALWGAERVRFSWRYDSRTATETFVLPDDMDAAVAFRRTLMVAITDDWAADGRGHPVRPGTETPAAPTESTLVDFPIRTAARAVTGPNTATVTALPVPASQVTDPDGFLSIVEGQWDDLRDDITHLDDFAALCTWRMADQQATMSKRGTKRAASTLADVEGELSVAETFFRYLPGDTRINDTDIGAHQSMRLDAQAGLSENDCLA